MAEQRQAATAQSDFPQSQGLKSGVSVVVCCYNSEDSIPETLEHLSKQELPPNFLWEVIIVDNASTDQTGAISKKLWLEFGSPTYLRIVEERTPGLSAARRCGVLCARYETLIFCDDDNWFDSDYVSVAANLMKDDSIGIAGGIGRAVSTIELPDWFESTQRSYAVGPPTKKPGLSKAYLYGAGMVLRTGTLRQAYENGFESLLSDRKGNELSSGGDGEICEWCHIVDGKSWFYSEELRFQHFIDPNRLTREYLTRLKRGFGRMYAVLRLYRKFRRNESTGISRWWIWRVIHAVLVMPIIVCKGYRKGQLRNAFVFQFEHLKWLLSNRGQYHHALKAIRTMYHIAKRRDRSF